ncbi:glycohydrolase toxin TNT-related protein [Terribacillus sp. AE2B 122]|uniref:TNT domain-containing protein n=1 Tax=Terribacillus sp. AE2B 122 TaxID=1331902 RepID=UPI0014407524|nr:glycohydrolase toxin TNT-related protein [Terribacillus sp. AE2B 122]VVM31672.1 Lmo0066 homolog within ESAT-6 gene cluster2C similarity to ADP-ribosylating toxins [Terribacillus sp. AE2B 122]
MDVKYRSSQWEKTRDSLRNLIGLGAWGKGMIDTMKDITDNLDEASEKVAKYDSDGVVSFSYTSDKDKYQRLFEDFKVLEDYSGSVGDIVEDKIDQPFYEDIDEFVQKVRDSSISNYTTKNHIGATETIPISYYGSYQEYTTEKTEITMDDILSGDNYYAEQIKASFEEWKVQNPDEDISYEDYRTAAVNTRAFEYESIEDGQFTKEFWVNIAALVVIVGVTVVCPPAGAVLGAAYATVEMGSAISGKDWASGRELDTTERWTRGILAPIDILPVGKAVTTFTGTARTTSKVIDVGQSASKINKTNSAVKQVDNVIELKIPAERLHAKTPSTGSAAGQADNVVSLTEHANKQTANRLRNSQWAVKEQDKVQELQKVAGGENLSFTNNLASNVSPIMMKNGDSSVSNVGPVKGSAEVNPVSADKVGRVNSNSTKVSSEVSKQLDDVKIPENMNKWDYPPSKELYRKYESVYRNPKYYDQETGAIHWPPEDGFVSGTQKTETLHAGMRLDRYGNPAGSFLAPESDSFPSRALAPHSELAPYYVYEVIDDLEVTLGKIAPWFDQPGGGTQIIKYKPNGRPYSIEELIELKVIKQINP